MRYAKICKHSMNKTPHCRVSTTVFPLAGRIELRLNCVSSEIQNQCNPDLVFYFMINLSSLGSLIDIFKDNANSICVNHDMLVKSKHIIILRCSSPSIFQIFSTLPAPWPKILAVPWSLDFLFFFSLYAKILRSVNPISTYWLCNTCQIES